MDSPILIAASLIACSLACLLVSTAAVDPNYLDDMTETGELEQLDPGSIIPISTPDPKPDTPAKPDSGTPAAQNASASWTIPEIAGTAVGGTTAFASAAAAARYIYRCVETGRLGVQIFQRILDLAQVFAARLQHGRPGEVIALPPI